MKLYSHRSQAATEYLMTYGWAFLIIAIVAAILISLGVFSPSSSSTVTGFNSFTSASASVSKTNGLVLTLTNTNPNTIYLTNVSLSSSSGLKIGKVSVLAKLGSYSSSNPLFLLYYNNSQITNLSIPSGQSFTIIISNISAYSSYSTQATITYFEKGIPQSSTGTISGTPVSSSLVPYFATMYFATITITNTQNVATPSPFQQMINVSSSSPVWSYINTNQNSAFGQNVEFVYLNGTVIPSWLESYSTTNAIWWIKIGSIPANSKLTIYMRVVNPSTNLFNNKTTGEAPQLSSTYAEYDDGANVFNFYDDFAGTTLKSVWTVPSGSNYTVNNGFIAKPSGGATTAVYDPSIQETSSIIIEWCLNLSSTTYPGSNSYFQLNRYTSYSNMDFLGVEGSDTLYNNGGTVTTETILSRGDQIFGVWNDGTTVTWYYPTSSGEASYTDTSATAETDYVSLGWAYNGQSYNFPIIYWVRVRAYPPNGVMPSVSIG
ncbi:MAG: DUF2341 domain-containing protein [Candidatus Parvarchaeota archaeon]|nr:DUF2341 domain-containing protein [Candidatus Rehaiarchaeum fermentans]